MGTPPKKKAPVKKSPLQVVEDDDEVQEELTIEQRLSIVETKVDFIYTHIAQQAAAQMSGSIQDEIKNQLLKGITNGPSTGNDTP